MLKISALNEDPEEESRPAEEVTREALEQIALKEYARALELQRAGNVSDARQLLKDLLETELLDEIQKPAEGEKVTGPLFNLKYLCYKNLGSMLSATDDVVGAIQAYCSASELDDTDVTLWHRLGSLCIKGKRYVMALYAFQQGVERNPNHWPCLDKIITLLLGLDYKEECISTIYETLQLDPGYLRGLVYRRHIYTTFNYIRDFMEYINPIYKWNDKKDSSIDEDRAQKLLKEAEDIHETFLEQQRAEKFKYILPNLMLKKSITKHTWESVGESLVHMHHHMTENYYSHACSINIVFEKEEEPMQVYEETKEIEPAEKNIEEETVTIDNNVDVDVSENENNVNSFTSDKDKITNETEKLESDIEIVPTDALGENMPEPKKRAPTRRRGSALSFLEQWEWCTKRRSGRKKTTNSRQDCFDDNIYDTLRRMVPICLSPDIVQKKEESHGEAPSPCKKEEETDKKEVEEYFGTENEQTDVKMFIDKHMENKHDIIDILNDYLSILAEKWRVKWPESISKLFIEANKCYNNHIDPPSYTDDNQQELHHYAMVNLLVEEFLINEKLSSANKCMDDKQMHGLSVIECVGLALTLRPQVFSSTELLEYMLRHLWVKVHIHILNKSEELGLDCLYQLLHEFEAMGEHHESYSLAVINFTFKAEINDEEISAYIKFFERNKKLSTVMDLYDIGHYEEVLSIALDSFEHCKNMAKKQEEEMSLDFAVQLSLILDAYWALDDVDNCFKWSLICLHEALKHYFRYTSGSTDYNKWTLTVVKILCCMEHILTTEGLSCIEMISGKELSQGLEDLIRIIGHQVETNSSEMPFGTVIPWIIMHFILQKEEDQGRGRTAYDKEEVTCDDIPNPLMLLFFAHEQLGNRGWCCKSEGKLLYFILDSVVPRLRSPSLSKSLEQVCQHMEQCVYCLFGHPGKKNKLKYLTDHNVTAHTLDWKRGQQVYEIYRPPILPALEGKISGITAESEQLFHRILELLPSECDPQKYVTDVEKYIKGVEDKLPSFPPLLPYKMKDIYFLLGDYYFKKEEGKMAIKYNILDVIINNDRLESWAEISLAKAVNLERLLNSCKNLNNDREILNPAKSTIRCFERSLQLDPTHCNMWIEYGIFVYTVHSFCSRMLKQASESLSMEDFEFLEKQKEDMLDATQKCFMAVLGDLNNSSDSDKANEDSWLHYYMLGKVAEKRNKPPSVYLDYYMKGVNSLKETNATYPLKINYSSPTHLCIEVLELHYRIHASILKYIEQHESKQIPISVGKVFGTCIEEWKNGPFTKKLRKDGTVETEAEMKTSEPVQAANIFKRSISDAGGEDNRELKKLKIESAAAKVKRSASYDTERLANKDPSVQNDDQAAEALQVSEEVKPAEKKLEHIAGDEEPKSVPDTQKNNKCENTEKSSTDKNRDAKTDKKRGSSSSSSSSSSSDCSSSDSSSASSSASSDAGDASRKQDSKPLPEKDIMKIVSACLDALEDCASRFPPHYKAIYRLAHYHFYYKKGKDIERCRDLMLSNYTSRAGQKLGGLFSERKHSNFFNNIWKIPSSEVDRAGGFAFHMNRSVLLTMEILKEIDDHKTLLDLNLHLQRIPELDKKYLRDSDREELAQQAFSLCVQSLKGQLLKFSQQADVKSNDVERQALKSLMLDIYRAYLRAQKQPNSKQFTNLLVDAYKLVTTSPITENMNLVDISMKYCQALIQSLKQQATQASLDKSQITQKKQTVKSADTSKLAATPVPSRPAPKKLPLVSSSSRLPKKSTQDTSSSFPSFLPTLNPHDLTRQTAAAFSLWTNLNTMSYNPALSLQSSFQAEFYRQFIGQSFSSFNPSPAKKLKRSPKIIGTPRASLNTNTFQMKPAKTFGSMPAPSVSKAPVAVTNLKKPSLAPSMGTVLPNLPPSMAANLAVFGTSVHPSHSQAMHTQPAQAHMSTASTVSAALHTKPPLPHQQASPGKTLQEKLAERQKHLPNISKAAKEITASISKLPSSLTITKTSAAKQPASQHKKGDAMKSLPSGNCEAKPKPISPNEVIVLDDD